MNPQNNQGEFTSEISMVKRILKKLVLCVVVIAVLAYPLTGFYLVGTNETGVLKRFGKIVDDMIPPGLHYRFPWPIDRVIRISTREITRFQAGFGIDPSLEKEYESEHGSLYNMPFGTFAVPYCITGDKNIIHLRVVGQYKIVHPREFLCGFQDPEQFLALAVQSCIIDTVCSTDVDTVLTTGRIMLQRKIFNRVQELMETFNSGISLVSLEIKNIRPPTVVASAFKDVVNAREERGTMIHDAEAYRNQIIPEAKAEASRMLNDAFAYKTKRIEHARGEAERFKLLAVEYSKAKDLTKSRIFLKSMARILAKVNKFVVDEQGNNPVANLKFFIREQENK